MKPPFHLLLGIIVVLAGAVVNGDQPWQMHIVDDQFVGADGVRLGDINDDGHLDIVTGWEESGVVRVYFNPGPTRCKSKWNAVTVGKAPNVEDAVFVDLDEDGRLDVVSSSEGQTMSHRVHWAPNSIKDLPNEAKWKTEIIPSTSGLTRWMFCLPWDMDGKLGVDLIIGSKNPSGQIGWLESPSNPRNLSDWKYHHLLDAGWIMSIRSADLNHDNRADLLVSDRKGLTRGVFWLHRAIQSNSLSVERHDLLGSDWEVMFLDVKSNGNQTVIATPTRNGKLVINQRHFSETNWHRLEIPNPNQIQNGKAVALGDINLDGTLDIVHSSNTQGMKSPVSGLSLLLNQGNHKWSCHPISSTKGVKFDRIELVDLDGDGDLDVLTCEERDNLGVIWFENPFSSIK